MVGGWERATVEILVQSGRDEFVSAVREACRGDTFDDVTVDRYRPADAPRAFEGTVGCLVVDLVTEDRSDALVAVDDADQPAVLVGGEDAIGELIDRVDSVAIYPYPTESDVPSLQPLALSIRRSIERLRCRDELERYRLMAETVPDGVYILDADFVYRYVNEAFADILGYDREGLIGAHLSKIHDETGIAAAAAARRRALARDDPIETTYNDHITADGERVPCEVQFRAITDDNGDLIGTIGILRDITERLEREQELERHNNRLRHFSRIVSHDIRSPLTVAQGNIELGMEADDPDPYFEKADEALDRLEDIVDDLLTLAEEGAAIEDPEPVDLDRVAQEATLVVDTTNATVDIDVEGETVMGESRRLRRLFENLFRNAVTHVGPDVTIRVGSIEDGFYVEDDGPGIPEEERERVFESGYTTSDEGTGYGLSIVEEIAATHGMGVSVTEGELGGARFEVTEEAPTTEHR